MSHLQPDPTPEVFTSNNASADAERFAPRFGQIQMNKYQRGSLQELQNDLAAFLIHQNTGGV